MLHEYYAPLTTLATWPSTEDDLMRRWARSGRYYSALRGGQIAFQSKISSVSSYYQIYKKANYSSTAAPTRINPQPFNQLRPDWSPRGDWVAFQQDSTSARSDIWVYNTVTAESPRRLTYQPGFAVGPAFNPNGQRLAYAYHPASGAWEVRSVGLDGSSDTRLVLLGSTFEPHSLRWSADGQHLYYVTNDSLYSVTADGATVSARTDLIPKVTSLDLPRGNGPLVTEQPGASFYPTLCGGDTATNQMPFRRLVVRNTTTGDTEARLYRTGTEFFNPRWSPNGMLVAYSSDQNTAGDRDLFVGQVSYNHAPALNVIGDRTAYNDVYYDIRLNASDPDGEAITYQAAFLPPGATLVGNLFHWSNPGPVGAVYFVVFRALDPSGGVASQVVKFTVNPGGCGGACPYGDARTSDGWQVENSVLSRSLAGAMALDQYRLKTAPQASGGRYQIRPCENEQEYTTLDQVSFQAVDHAADVGAYPVAGRVVLGSPVAAHQVLTSAGADITTSVDGIGAEYFIGTPGETLLVQFEPPSGTGALTLDDPGATVDALLFETNKKCIPDQEGNPGGEGGALTALDAPGADRHRHPGPGA